MTDLSETIDERLNLARPDRYEPGDESWLLPIIADVADDIPSQDARQRVARDIVIRREAEATKRTNRVLRDIVRSGQMPFEWFDIKRWPLSVGDQRVALGACTSDDFREFANIERRRAANDFATRNESCEGAEFIADLIDDKGVTCADDLVTIEQTS